MRFLTRSRDVAGRTMLGLALMSLPVFAAQHKTESKPPAQHESKPSKPSSPSHSHPSHPSGGNHASGESHPSGGSHASAPSHESKPSTHAPSANHSGTGANANHGNESHGNPPANHTGNAGSNRSNSGPNRGAAPSSNRDEVMARNRGGAPSHPVPGHTVSLKNGGSASVRPNGQIRSINRNGMQIHNNLSGGHTVVSEHNGTRIVGVGHGNGYVQRAYVTRGGHSYYSRTYYSHGVYRTAVYRSYYYHGSYYYGYHPAFWFHPGFYGWAYHPWGVGIFWGVGFGGWGWAGAPWYGYYGPYFAPYPVYPSAAFWLTDYLIAADLQASYAARAEANAEVNAQANAIADDAAASAYSSGAPSNPGPDNGGASASATVTLTPEVKEAIAEEVKAELAAQQAAAQGGADAQAQPAAPAAAPANGNEVPPALDPARRNFVVDNNITVASDGQECELTGGDVITRLTDTPDADNKVTASVSASKKTDCAAGKSVLVSVDDLQEMRNHLEEQLADGLKTLQEKQGTGGMPKAPDTGMTVSDIPAPEPDKTAEKALSDQDAAANQAETEAKQETAAAQEAPTTPPAPDVKQ